MLMTLERHTVLSEVKVAASRIAATIGVGVRRRGGG
jgi:hypothetical protein